MAVNEISGYSKGVALSVLIWIAAMPAMAGPASDDFQMACAACHTIGGGRLVGPDLENVHQRRSNEWLQQFIKSSQSLIQSGDPDAVAVFEEYNKMIMPDSVWSDAQISAAIAYIEEASGAPSEEVSAADAEQTASTEIVAVPPSPQVDAEASADSVAQIDLGRGLFQGTTRLSAGGVACNACHDLNGEGVVGGGSLARELTTTYSTMGEAGIRAVITQPPFPVMRTAYEGRPLTDEEASALTSFLRQVDATSDQQSERNYGAMLLSGGVVGSLALFGFCGVVWRGRRKGSVNQAIYDRQDRTG